VITVGHSELSEEPAFERLRQVLRFAQDDGAFMYRRDFLEGIAVAAAAGLAVSDARALARGDDGTLYDAATPFGNVSLLHFTDCHAQLLPTYYREPSVNLGVGGASGKPPHLRGDALLKHFAIAPGTRDAHAFTYL